MQSDDSDNEIPIIVRVPSNVMNAATSDATPGGRNGEEEKGVSETESSEAPRPEFKEGGYGW